ncbi:hypothetical protein DPMN_181036 [Dreissena polymorpha]|uniref:Uncharacterized protein n=1 Tax=Dreissena polymorpha TaxID=45954 RepID=A0A9D4DBK3_DREPO|nr:hypothetical protein DPMN_181036 [Dreissena polymorpha]
MSQLSTDNTTLTLGPRPFVAPFVSTPPRHGWLSPDLRSPGGVQRILLTAAQITLARPSVLWRCPTLARTTLVWRVPVGPCRRYRLLSDMAAVCPTVVGGGLFLTHPGNLPLGDACFSASTRKLGFQFL